MVLSHVEIRSDEGVAGGRGRWRLRQHKGLFSQHIAHFQVKTDPQLHLT